MSVALPDSLVTGNNVDKETWFHGDHSTFLILILILIDSQPPVARQLWISHVVRSD